MHLHTIVILPTEITEGVEYKNYFFTFIAKQNKSFLGENIRHGDELPVQADSPEEEAVAVGDDLFVVPSSVMDSPDENITPENDENTDELLLFLNKVKDPTSCGGVAQVYDESEESARRKLIGFCSSVFTIKKIKKLSESVFIHELSSNPVLVFKVVFQNFGKDDIYGSYF